MRKPFFPNLTVLLNYPKAYFGGDLSAGLTVGVMLIPQGMAYAMIAGLPPVYGLYAAFVPQIVYALLGSSRQLAVGPVAMDSLLVATGLSAIPHLSPEKYVALALVLALYVGGLQMIFGQLKLGFLVQLLSKPVMSGFTSGAALIIGFSQLHHLLGIDLPKNNSIQTLFSFLMTSGANIHPITVTIGGVGILWLLMVKKFFPRIPGAILLVITGIILSQAYHWDALGVRVVKEIPGGLPGFRLPSFAIADIIALTPLAFTIALVAFMEAIAVAKAIDEKNNTQHVVPNKELVALGAANFLGAFFQSYPTTGGFSRTAVNNQAGAKSSLAALISALVIGLTLHFFTASFYHLPNALLGAIIVVAVIQLVDFSYPVQLWKNNRAEALVLLFTFSVTLFVGIVQGLLLGVLVALGYTIFHLSQPHIAVLGRIKGSDYFKNIERFPEEAVPYKGVLILRFDGPLFFGNQAYFKSAIKTLLDNQKSPVNSIVINAVPMHYVDATALHMLQQWVQELNEQDIRLFWVQLTGPLRDRFHLHGLTDRMEDMRFFSSLTACMQYINEQEISAIDQKIAHQTNRQ